MSICQYCDTEMNDSPGCVEVPVRIRAGEFAPIRFAAEGKDSTDSLRCHDCNALVGGFHHRGCDSEDCPNCRRQLISFRQTPTLSLDLWSENHFCFRVPIFTCQEIFDGDTIPLLVIRDDDADWQVLDGESTEGRDLIVAFVADVRDIHPSLDEVLDLAVGWEAWRQDADSPWVRSPLDAI
jgi:hypothetical protein